MNEIQGGDASAADAGRHEGALCAFCRKSKQHVGPLVESEVPEVYICYGCAQLCVHVIEEECKRRGVPVPEG
jgi:hypothetical protein